MTALAQAFSRLDAMAQVLDGMKEQLVPERYADEYDSVLDQMEREGVHVAEFRLRPGDVAPRTHTVSYITQMRRLTEEAYVRRELLLMKVRGLLGYFTLLTASPPKQVGFRPPEP